MKKVAIIACGAYMDSGYGCPGEWRCLKAAAQGDGQFSEAMQVTAFVKCECPGRSAVNNLGMALQLSEIKPDLVHISSCMSNAKPSCPYASSDEFADMIRSKTGLAVVLGTHDYH